MPLGVLHRKDAACAVALAESLLPAVPVKRAAFAACDHASEQMADEDEDRMIEIVSRA